MSRAGAAYMRAKRAAEREAAERPQREAAHAAMMAQIKRERDAEAIARALRQQQASDAFQLRRSIENPHCTHGALRAGHRPHRRVRRVASIGGGRQSMLLVAMLLAACGVGADDGYP